MIEEGTKRHYTKVESRRWAIKIRIENIIEGTEPEIIIRCNEMDESLLQWVQLLKSNTSRKLIGEQDGALHLIEPKNILYFEAVDNRVFIYCKSAVYETRKKLHQIEEEFENSDFIRVSKSVILNLNKVNVFSPAFSGRFEAILSNEEKVIISRQYVPVLKKKLGL